MTANLTFPHKLAFQSTDSIRLPVNSAVRPVALQLIQKNAVALEASSGPLAPTIFHEPWWLDIVTGGNYKMLEVTENGKAVGRLPYFPKKRFGLTYSIMPPMTHFLGPAVIEGDGSAQTRALKREDITRELIQKLPHAALYNYKCHRDITDTIAFQQERFTTNVQFTHEILPQPEEILWGNLRGKKRWEIRRAQENFTIGEICDPQKFWNFYADNLKARGIQNICDEYMCVALVDACLTRKSGKIYAAYDKNNTLVAAAFCMWDKTTSYYFMSSRMSDIQNGAASLLAWEAIKDASSRGLIFDFDGISNSSGVLFYRQFGSTISPRYIVTRTTAIGKLALMLKDLRRDSKYFF